MARNVLLLCSVFAALAACKGTDDAAEGPLQVTGPNGASVLESAAVSAYGSCTRSAVALDANMFVGMFSTAAGICEDLAGAITPPHSTTVFVAAGRFGASGADIALMAPERFTVIRPDAALPPPDARGSAAVAFVTVERYGGAPATGQGCQLDGLSIGVSGTVTVRDFRIVDGETLAVIGQVDAMLDDGGRVVGTFDVPMCPAASEAVRSDCTALAIPLDTSCE